MWLAVRNLPLDDVRAVLGGIEPGWMIVAFAAHAVRVALAAVRWSFLTGDFEEGWVRRSASNVLVGFALNNVLPFRAGDLSRIWLGRSQLNGDGILSGILVLIEKLFDVAALLLFLAVGFVGISRGWGTLGFAILCLATLALLPGAMSPVARTHVHGRDQIVDSPLSLRKRLLLAGSIAKGRLGGERLSAVSLLTVLTWGMEGATYLFVLHSLGVFPALYEGAFVLGAGNLAGVIPAMPGAWGTFELAAQSSMRFFGVDTAVAFTAAVLIHLTVFVPPTIIGSVIVGPSFLRRSDGVNR